MSEANEPLAAFFDEARRVFAQAAGDGAVVRDYALAGRAWRVHYVDAALAQALSPALEHLSAPPSQEPFNLYAWGGERPGGQLPPPPWETLPFFERGNVRGYLSDDYSLIYDRKPGAFSGVDQARQVGVYWAREATNLPDFERAAPFRRLLPHWRQADGLLAAHAAAVGFPEGGALLAGRTGSGKSTTAALCIGSPLGYAGDDYMLLAPGPEPYVYGLYNSVKLNRTVLDWAPQLMPHVVNNARPLDKAQVYVSQVWPEAVSTGFPLRAILLPHPTDGTETTVRPVAAEAAYKILLPDTLFLTLGRPQQVARALNEVVRAVPAYELALGRAVPGVIAAVTGVLEAARSKV